MNRQSPHRRHGNRIRSQGFTLVELVVVLVIMGILATYVGNRWSASDTTLHAQAAQLARDIRHAQALAMNQGRRLALELPNATSYRVTDGGAVITDPATQQAFNRGFTNGVSRTGSCGTIIFDTLGRPISGANLLASTCTYRLNSDSNNSTITLTPVTGFISVSP